MPQRAGGRSRGALLCWVHKKQSFICHLTQGTEIDGLWGTRTVTKFHLFPLNCTWALSPGQVVGDLLVKVQLLPGRQSRPPSCRDRSPRLLSQCLTYLPNLPLWCLACASQIGFTVPSSSRSTDQRLTVIISTGFPCAWQKISLYLFRKAPQPPKAHFTSAAWLVDVAIPLPRPNCKTSSSHSWQLCSLSQDP